MEKYIKYTHASAREFTPGMSYKLSEVLKSLKIEDIKVFFTPISFDWKDTEVKPSNAERKK